jgi:hypothetical protein
MTAMLDLGDVHFRIVKMFFRKPQPAQFWTWFQANAAKFEAFVDQSRETKLTPNADEADRVLSSICKQLQQFDRRLFCQLGPTADGYDLVITADGDADAFPKVFELIKAAPALERWVFTPLKPRTSGLSIETSNVKLSADTARYYIAQGDDDPEKAIVLLLVDGSIRDDVFEEYQGLSSLLVEQILGEYVFATQVEAVFAVGRDKFAERWGHDGSPLSELDDEFAQMAMN